MSKKEFFIFLLVLVFLFPFSVVLFWPTQKLTFIACSVGEGDAILLTKGFTQVLIDGGPNDQVLNCLAQNIPFYDRTIELVINTHPDKDHVTGLVEVLKRFQVKQILAYKFDIESNIAKQFYSLITENQVSLYSPKKGEKIKLDGLEFITLWPDSRILGATSAQSKTNQASLVLHLRAYDFDAVLTGDITEKEEGEIIKDYRFEDIEVLKVAHHGSKYSSSENFLEAVKPQIAIISVGKNQWGHPTKEVLDRLQGIGAKILRTDQQTIKLSM
ncbi:MAG TPA: MBL fold metallo-hydrolase [Candidatus Bathyarchaeia archaeon]|nr:MBL fold metallo-hydrolase [Candidatus Bathyarchaeia archaeon]